MDKTFSFRKDLYGLAGLMVIASPSVEVFAGESPAVAVFDIQDTRKKGALSKDSLNSLTGYVRSQMAKGGRLTRFRNVYTIVELKGDAYGRQILLS